MASIFRAPLETRVSRSSYQQVEHPPNLPTSFFPKLLNFRNDISYFPDRTDPRKWAQDFIWSGTTTRGIPLPPVTALQFRTPLIVPIFGRPALKQDDPPNNLTALYAISAGRPPFIPPQFPEFPRASTRQFDIFEALSYLPGPVVAPYIPVDFPNPTRAKANPQDYAYQGTIWLPVKPFHQDEWPYFIRARALLQDFLLSGDTTRKIPSGVSTPFNQADWPITYPRKFAFHDIPPVPALFGLRPAPPPGSFHDWPTPERQHFVPGDSFSSPQITLTTVYPKPFSQSEWPNFPRPKDAYFIDEPNVLIRGVAPAPLGPVMPDLYGIPFLEALERLQSAGIYLPIPAFSFLGSQISVKWMKSSLPGGFVVGQSIAAGLGVKAGTPITLTVSTFPFSSVIDMPPDWTQNIPPGFKA